VPPATAREHSPDHIARHAVLMATSDDEQAVSIVKDGPVQPK